MFRPVSRPAFRLGTVLVSSRSYYIPTLYKTTSGKMTEPLRILFCGTDTLSCESLHALHEEWKYNRALVEEIEVVCLPSRPQGRGRMLNPVPVRRAADALGLAFHQIPTFTGWEVPKGINLIVAVSFGLFVPPRVLRSAKYGGLNLHPSFLPDLRGPAPIHHAMLRGDTHMGCSLQTMDEEKFDHGVVLAQTPAPGLRVMMNPTLSRVNRKMAMECADLLIEGLRSGAHVPPYEDKGWKAADLEGKPLQHAPKIGKSDTQIDWINWTAEDWRRRLQLSQAVWTLGISKIEKNNFLRRVIFHDAQEVPYEDVKGYKATMEVIHHPEDSEEVRYRKLVAVDTRAGDVYILLDKNTWIRCRRATLEGRPERAAYTAVKDLIVEYGDSDKPPSKEEAKPAHWESYRHGEQPSSFKEAFGNRRSNSS